MKVKSYNETEEKIFSELDIRKGLDYRLFIKVNKWRSVTFWFTEIKNIRPEECFRADIIINTETRNVIKNRFGKQNIHFNKLLDLGLLPNRQYLKFI